MIPVVLTPSKVHFYSCPISLRMDFCSFCRDRNGTWCWGFWAHFKDFILFSFVYWGRLSPNQYPYLCALSAISNFRFEWRNGWAISHAIYNTVITFKSSICPFCPFHQQICYILFKPHPLAFKYYFELDLHLFGRKQNRYHRLDDVRLLNIKACPFFI